jgi:hypothetical protein
MEEIFLIFIICSSTLCSISLCIICYSCLLHQCEKSRISNDPNPTNVRPIIMEPNYQIEKIYIPADPTTIKIAGQRS